MMEARLARGRRLQEVYGERLAVYSLKWSKRWNYEGWMLTGIEGAKIWVEDEQAELFIKGLTIMDGDML